MFGWFNKGIMLGGAKFLRATRNGLIVSLSALLIAVGLVPANAVAPIGSSNFLKQIQTQNLSGILGTTSTNNPASSISLNGVAYFIGAAPETGAELYSSDGTPAGTNIVKDAVPGIQGAVQNLVLSHGKLFFASGDSTSAGNLEPWISDGTAAGTFKIKEIAPGAGGSSPYSFTQGPNGLTYFLADDATTSLAANGTSVYNGAAIWVTDGTTAGTYKVKDVNTYSYGPSSTYYYPAQSSISGMTSCAGKLFFSASDDNYNSWNELWVSDGTEAGTQEVKDINQVAATISIGMYSPSLNSTIAAGTVTNGGSAPQNFVCLNDIMYFSADDGYGRTLWRSDG
ncbi:MAG: hypothetical protein KA421_05375, partial [Rhodoluna sp.]|nr:hypothetical protein [Rhodoluna sp.]